MVQFTSGNAFSVTLGSLRASGTMEEAETGVKKPALPLHIGTEGVDFFLDDQNPLMAYASEKSGVPLKVTGFVTDDAGFTIEFAGGVSVFFSSEKRGDADVVSIAATIPSKYQKVVFPYKITRSARLEKKDSLVLVNVGKKQYVFTGVAVDPAIGSVRGLSVKRSAPVVYYQTWIPAKGLSLEDFGTIAGASDEDYGKNVDAFAAKALVSFKESISAGKFTEPLVAAYIAEMGRIGMYHAAVESIPDSWRNGPGRTWQTNTFLNHLERTWSGFMSKEREDRSMISRKLTENNPSVFEYPALVPYLVDRGSSILLKDVSRLATVIDMTAITTRQAAGILEAMGDFSAYVPNQDNTLLALSDSCERKLKASFVMAGDGLYISDDGKTVDSLESLQIASILIRYGASPEKTPWKNAGHLLVASLVAACGENGNLSERFELSGTDGQAGKTGISPKEDKVIDASVVYPVLVTGNTWYPHVSSFAKEAGAGVWAWTSAQSVIVSKPADGIIKIRAQFPQGETHYMVFRGIKPFYRISIYGMDFHTDPRFETYNSSGYRYDEKTETLYLKMRHKAEYEDVVVYTGSDPSKPAPAANEAGAAAEDAASFSGEGSAATPSGGLGL